MQERGVSDDVHVKDYVKEHCTEFQILPMKEKSAHDVQMLLTRYQDEINGAWKDLAPHRICSYIYALANNFNSLYHDVKFLNLPEKEKESCMALLMLIFRVLSTCIHTLGFGAPERM